MCIIAHCCDLLSETPLPLERLASVSKRLRGPQNRDIAVTNLFHYTHARRRSSHHYTDCLHQVLVQDLVIDAWPIALFLPAILYWQATSLCHFATAIFNGVFGIGTKRLLRCRHSVRLIRPCRVVSLEPHQAAPYQPLHGRAPYAHIAAQGQ